MLQQLKVFLLRATVIALALMVADKINLISFDNGLRDIVVASIILAILNAIIKPLLIIFTLPAIILSLGLFTIIINGFIVFIASWLFGGFKVETFWSAVLVGMLVGLVNYIVTIGIDRLGKNNE